MKIIPRASKKPMRWPCVQMKRSSPSCEPVFLLSPLFWLFSCLGCKVVDRCVIYDYEMARKFCLLLWNFAKHSIAICSRHCFCPSVSNAFSCLNFQIICDVPQSFKYLLCLLAPALSVDDHPVPRSELSAPLLELSHHLVDPCNAPVGSS